MSASNASTNKVSEAFVLSASQRQRLSLFESEYARQRAFTQDRVSKMHVHYKGLPEDLTLVMNRGLSTPLDCAAHVQELLCKRSIIALVDGKPWDMNRPIQLAEDKEECTLEFLHMKDANPKLANVTFWRSCSFLLGAIVEVAFKDQFTVNLCSFPSPNPSSGSFVYDVQLLSSHDAAPFVWRPTSHDLRLLSMLAQRLALDAVPFEPLEVNLGLATEMFAGSPLKAAQLPAIADAWRGPGNPRVTVYRLGHHVDICRGPLMSHSGQVGRFSVTAVHSIEAPSYGPLLRFQGVALPPEFLTHFTTFELLRRHGAGLNSAPLPSLKQLQEGEEK